MTSSAALSGSSWLYPTSTPATSHTVPLPQYANGNLLLMFVSSTVAAVATASGWTQLFAENRVSSAGQDRLTCLYRIADGTEGTSVVINLAASQNVAAIVYSVSRYSGGTLESSVTTGNSTTPDSPSLSPAMGIGEYLWVTAFATTGARYVIAYPIAYGVSPMQLFNGLGVSTARTILGVAAKAATALSDNPGAWTLNTSFEWVSATVAVPLSPAGGVSRPVNPFTQQVIG